MASILSNSTLNATLTNPATYFDVYNEFSKYHVQLNVFERLWAVSKTPPRHGNR